MTTEQSIKPIVMPKWGLSMSEGKLTGWLKKAGDKVAVGDQIVEVETDKIAGALEAGDAGILRRTLGEVDTVYPVKALIGIIANASVPDSEIDAYVSSYVTPTASEDEEAEAESAYAFVETPVGSIRYAKRGEGGDAVILVHGFGGDLDNWLFNIDALASRATVYALDLPGHGQSTKTVPENGFIGLAKGLLDFMDALGIERAHLIGHSMGGAISILAALEAPERVRSLTLIDSAGLGSEINADYLNAFVSASSRRELKPVVEQLFADPQLVSRQMLEDLLKYKRIDGVEAALKSISAQFLADGRQQLALAPKLAGFDKPILVVWGEDDRVIPAAHAKALEGRAKLEVIPGAGHMAQMEKASRVNEVILTHLGL
ncbi:MAG TPA: acetoin dehydrogenase dihydrolipoyllysine-residue acetyltransferase subunit [Roseiarcus sp.]|nr:acetoin dehydrogenase dihydrolipoyllysine-residue acetyltransferase subunit [Roseiarcus sp.]